MQSTKGWLDYLKLRASWGQLGNQDALSDYYPAISTYNLGGAYPFDGQINTGYYQSTARLSTISWEKSTSWGIGLDFTIFHDLTGTIDYYNRKTTGIIMDVAVPYEFALGAYKDNIGAMRNSGIEVSLNYNHNFGKDWTLNIGANFAYNKNKILHLGENDEDIELNGWVGGSESILRVGENMSAFYGYRRLGVYTQEDYNNGLCELNQVGRAKRTDKKEIIGKGMPDWTGSWINNFSYKNFDLTMDFQFVWGVETMQQFYHSTYDRFGITNGLSNILYDAYNGSNPNTMQQAIYLCNDGHAGQDTTIDDSWIANGSYLRLNMLQLGYTFDSAVAKKIGLAGLRVYASGNNLFLITSKDYNGYDPEGTSQGDNKFGQNMTFFSYPRARTYTFGVNVTF